MRYVSHRVVIIGVRDERLMPEQSAVDCSVSRAERPQRGSPAAPNAVGAKATTSNILYQ